MNTSESEQQHPYTLAIPYPKVILAFSAFMFIGANDGALGVILPSLRAYYHIDNVTLGLLFFASTIGYFFTSFNNGLLIEKLGMHRFLLLGTTIALISMTAISCMPPFLVIAIAMLFLGISIASLDAGLNAYIASLPRNTVFLNYLHTHYGVGAWLGPIIASGLLTFHQQWNTVYILWSGMSLLLLLGFSTLFKGSTSATESVKQEGNILIATLRLRAVWLAAIFLLFYVGSEVSLGSWSYSFLVEERHGTTLISGWMVSGYWLGLTLGRLLLARVGERIGNQRLIAWCLLGVLTGLLLIWLIPLQSVTAGGLFFTGFCLGPIFPTTIALMSTLVPSRVLASTIGFMASFGSMGAALFPWLAGNITQYLGWWSLLPYVITLTTMMYGLWLLMQKQPGGEKPHDTMITNTN